MPGPASARRAALPRRPRQLPLQGRCLPRPL